MPLGIDSYCISSSDLRAATNGAWGLHRVRAIVRGLPSIDGPKTSRRSYKLFRPTDLLPRLRAKPKWTVAFEASLLQIIQAKEFRYD